jgi:CRP-like cAMP-binding protein
MQNDVAIAGNLSFLNLGELMQMLGSNGSSGVLRIYHDQVAEPGVVYFDKGNPIDASARSDDGLEAIYSLFGWIAGRFEFVQQDVTCEKSINKSRMEIILDGLRMLDEGKIEKLESPNGGQAAVSGENRPQQGAAAKTETSSGKVPIVNGPLVDYSYVVDEESFRDGDDIIQEGNHGDWIWVVLEGTAEIVKQTAKGPVSILGISDGAFLGSMSALLSGNNVRSATARAMGNIQLGMLDTQLLTSQLAPCSVEMKNLIKTLDSRLREATNMAVEVYQNKRKVSGLLNNRRQVMKQGQKEKRLFRIREGSAVVAQEIDGVPVPLVTLRPGDFFGSIPFLNLGQEPHSASVYATNDMKIHAINTDKLTEEYERLPSMLRNLIEHQATCVSVTSLVMRNFIE